MKPSQLRSIVCCISLLASSWYIVLQASNFERNEFNGRLDCIAAREGLYHDVQHATNGLMTDSTISPNTSEFSQKLSDQLPDVAKYLDGLLHVQRFKTSDPAAKDELVAFANVTSAALNELTKSLLELTPQTTDGLKAQRMSIWCPDLAFPDPVAKHLPHIPEDSWLLPLCMLFILTIGFWLPYYILCRQQFSSWKSMFAGWVVAIIPTVIVHGGYTTYAGRFVYICIAFTIVITEICHWRYGWYEESYRNRLATEKYLYSVYKDIETDVLDGVLDRVEQNGNSDEESSDPITTETALRIRQALEKCIHAHICAPTTTNDEKPAPDTATPPPPLIDCSAEDEKAGFNGITRLQPPPAPACSESRTRSSVSRSYISPLATAFFQS